MSISIAIKLEGATAVQAALKKLASVKLSTHPIVQESFKKVGFLLSREARALAPIGIARKTTGARSGLLKSAINFIVNDDGVTVGVDVGDGDTKRRRYASAQEFGARPHPIAARNKTFLTFFVGGRWVKRRSVSHPGNVPQFFLSTAAAEQHERVVEIVAKGVGRAVKSFLGDK